MPILSRVALTDAAAVGGKAPRCGSCGLYKGCQTPRMPPTGEGRKGVLVVAEAPGEEEDRQGVQLVGRSGQHFRRFLDLCGVNLDRDCWKTNAVCCRPPHNETPSSERIAACRPLVMKALTELKPKVVLLLGAAAVESVIGAEWDERGVAIGRWVGWKVPSQRWNAWLCPLWHPAYLLRENDAVLELWFRRYLERALALRDRPYPNGVPDYRKQVRVVYSGAEAAQFLRGVNSAFAFDFETDRLKPDAPDASVVTCAVSTGKLTVAFPWQGEAAEELGRLLRSDVPKIGWNIKFEERWVWRLYGHGVRRWVWDGMQAAHVLDNRSGITGLKFQAYVRLGVPPYDGSVAPYMTADGGNEKNRVWQAPLADVLLYNGMDALMTYLIAKQQRKELLGCCR